MWRSLAALLLQQPCPSCGRPSHHALCPSCERRLQAWALPHRRQYWQGSLPLLPWGSYRQDLKRAIARLKYDNHPELGTLFGQWLALSWLEAKVVQSLPLQVVPIPLHRDKLKARGFNQAEVIAASFCRALELPLIPQALVRQRPTQSMFQLTAAERVANLKDAFCVGRGLRPHHWILLCDDIYTTGITARTAAQTLQAAGHRVVGMVTVAVAVPEPLIALADGHPHQQ